MCCDRRKGRVRQEFKADRANEPWIGDITEHWTNQCKLDVCPFKDASVVWTSDRDGKLGAGSLLLTRADELADELAVGTHILIVTATDSDGAKSSSNVTMHGKLIDEVPDVAAICAVDFQPHGAWSGGFAARVTVKNTGPDPIDGWSLGWELVDAKAVTRHWDAKMVTGTSGVTASNLSWNRVIAPGGTVSFGFNGAIDSDTAPNAPKQFTLNGETCS